jgi:two-component system OmpR family response regulator
MRKKILFVDDDPGMLIVGSMFIKSLGYNVLLAKSGEEAINIIKNSKSEIDCIFLDLMMPGLGGFDVLTFMRDSNIIIPVAMQTGLVDDSDIKKAEELGVTDYICKPYTKENIKNAIAKMLISIKIII